MKLLRPLRYERTSATAYASQLAHYDRGTFVDLGRPPGSIARLLRNDEEKISAEIANEAELRGVEDMAQLAGINVHTLRGQQSAAKVFRRHKPTEQVLADLTAAIQRKAGSATGADKAVFDVLTRRSDAAGPALEAIGVQFELSSKFVRRAHQRRFMATGR